MEKPPRSLETYVPSQWPNRHPAEHWPPCLLVGPDFWPSPGQGDQGIGIPEKLLVNIFKVDKITTRLGTNEERGTGFGMTLVKRFMNDFEGDIEILSKDQQGTEVKLTFKRGDA